MVTKEFLPVSEIFTSIQGEGPSSGIPAVFLRLSFCNLTCSFCDTIYTWKKPVNVKRRSIEKVSGIIEKSELPNLIITGGEPLLWQNQLTKLLYKINKNRIEVETNGTIIPQKNLYKRVTQFNVSPKLENSKVDKDKRLNPYALRFFSKSPKSIFKYVIKSQYDIQEVLDHINTYEIAREKVYLMPEGKTRYSLNRKRSRVVELSIQHNLNYTDRLHIILWNGRCGK